MHQADAAEQYMNSRRDELAEHGYQIRKLNQAYFAFYGYYGENAAASTESPIPGLLRRLRVRSGGLAAFVTRVSAIPTVEQLRAAVEE